MWPLHATLPGVVLMRSYGNASAIRLKSKLASYQAIMEFCRFAYFKDSSMVAHSESCGRKQCQRVADEAGAVDDALVGLDRHQ